jgi:hypothetical protein
MKNLYVFSLLTALCLIVFSGCFQPVKMGETYVEKATAYLRVTNDSEDADYILEGIELRNAAGEAVESWDGLDLRKGKTWEVHIETEGSFTLWYRVKDTWISAKEARAYRGRQVEIKPNQPHEFSFKGEGLEQDPDDESYDSDNDGLPDAWERDNGLNPNNPADSGVVYVSASGLDTNNGTQGHAYRTLAKAAAKAARSLKPEFRTVVVEGELNPTLNDNDHLHAKYPGREDSVFYLGKTRNPVTIKGESNATLTAAGLGKRVLYLDTGANIVLENITITGGMGSGGGIYASGATLTLGSGTKITGNNTDNAVSPITGGGIYMVSGGGLVMEGGSSIYNNAAYMCGGIKLFASTLTMKGNSSIRGNYADFAIAGLRVENSTLTMLDNAEISNNMVGKPPVPPDTTDTTQRDVGGGATVIFGKITMKGSSKISGNKAYNGWGGGVQVSGMGTLLMEDSSEISGNECTAAGATGSSTGSGGGVFVDYGGELRMRGSSVIKGNTAGKKGGGVYLHTGTSFFMEGGTIYGNEAEITDDSLKNTVTTGDANLSPKYGHAIYDRRLITKIDYDNTVTPDDFPQSP